MTREQIEMLAVALGSPLATVRARLAADYGAAPAAPAAGGVRFVAKPDGSTERTVIKADGSEEAPVITPKAGA